VPELVAALSRRDLGYIHHTGVVQHMQGHRGNDRLAGTAQQEVFWGRRGNDRLMGRGGNDELNGGIGYDTLLGGRGSDVLSGGRGNDVLNGGSGTDILLGGAGADTFILHLSQQSSRLSQVDIIEDFRAKQGDVIQLTNRVWLQSLLFRPIDTNSDGLTDATLIQVGTANPRSLAIVMNTVTNGISRLTTANFIAS